MLPSMDSGHKSKVMDNNWERDLFLPYIPCRVYLCSCAWKLQDNDSFAGVLYHTSTIKYYMVQYLWTLMHLCICPSLSVTCDFCSAHDSP